MAEQLRSFESIYGEAVAAGLSAHQMLTNIDGVIQRRRGYLADAIYRICLPKNWGSHKRYYVRRVGELSVEIFWALDMRRRLMATGLAS